MPKVHILAIAVVTAIFVHAGSAQKKEESLRAGKLVLWMPPGDVSSFDFQYGVGGKENQPEPPFRFVNEDSSGSNPKINVIDARGTKWNVKWGYEARPSTFCTRLARACGYVAVPEYFLARGRIDGVHGLDRAASYVASDGSFVDARFQLRTESPKFLKDYGWTWTDNPFVGTHELHGLMLLTVLVSDVDAKDANLGIFEADDDAERRYLYAVIDWGQSLGEWGYLLTKSFDDCKAFAAQSLNFVKGVEKDRVLLNFTGKHRKELTEEITVSDVQWLMQYLGKITDGQLRSGLAASGMTPEETNCYAQALEQRIEQLRRVATRQS